MRMLNSGVVIMKKDFSDINIEVHDRRLYMIGGFLKLKGFYLMECVDLLYRDVLRVDF